MDNCINNHKFDDILVHEFIKNQKKSLENIECNICNNNKNLYNNNFYVCSCGKNICKLCLEEHNIENHNIIEYNKRYYTCNIHNKIFISFCYNCNQNLCQECEQMHKKHKIILYKMEKPNDIKIKNMRKEIEENILNIFSQPIIFFLILCRKKFKVKFAIITSKYIDMLFSHTKKSLLNRSNPTKQCT